MATLQTWYYFPFVNIELTAKGRIAALHMLRLSFYLECTIVVVDWPFGGDELPSLLVVPLEYA